MGKEETGKFKERKKLRKISLKNRLVRYRQIGNILVKYGFGIILERTHLFRVLKLHPHLFSPHLRGRIEEGRGETLSIPKRLRLICEELGPTFIKLGQILSTRPDLIPLPLIKEFEKLQDEVKPLKTEVIEKVIGEELGDSPEKLFSSFVIKPLASASISQVHRAKLKNGKEIVLKVQKPGITKVIDADLEILHNLASLIEKFIKEAAIYQPERIVEEFEKSIKKELNFSLEARNIKRYSGNFAADETVYIPELYPDLTTKKILALEYVRGTKVSEVEKLERLGLDRKEIALNGAKVVLKQIFVDGFFHADPHPGNILILKNGKICYLDFGIVGKLGEKRKGELTSLFDGFLHRDAERIVRTILAMGTVEENIDLRALRRETEEMIDEYYGVPLKEINLKEITNEEFGIMRKFKIKIPADLSLLTKALITTEGVGTLLDPDFNIIEQVKSFAKKLMKERLSLFNLVKELKKIFSNLYFSMRELPENLEVLLRNIKKGYINIAFEHKGLKDLTMTMNKSSNRMSFALIISALIISSALIMLSGKGPLIMGFPTLGILGFMLASILGLFLIVSILKGGKF